MILLYNKSSIIVNNVKALAAKIIVFHIHIQKLVSKIMDSAN